MAGKQELNKQEKNPDRKKHLPEEACININQNESSNKSSPAGWDDALTQVGEGDRKREAKA